MSTKANTTERPVAPRGKPAAPGPAGPRDVMIETFSLSKYYKSFAALVDVSISVPRGQVCGLLGPNGAGKSTTMKLLTGYLAPTAGRVVIAGHDMETDRIAGAAHLGYLPENGPLYNEMTPRSALAFLGRTRGLNAQVRTSRMDYVMEQCALEEVWHKPIGKLSRGFRQRVGMAQALLHDPDILILDEPTSGLDPNQLVGIRRLIRELGQSKTVVLSTHVLQEVAALCDRVILINEGRVVLDGPLAEMGTGDELQKNFHRLTGYSH